MCALFPWNLNWSVRMKTNVIYILIIVLELGIIGWMWSTNNNQVSFIERLQKTIDTTNSELNQSKSDNIKLREGLELKKAEIYALEEDLDNKAKEIDQLEQQRQTLNTRILRLNESLKSIQDAIAPDGSETNDALDNLKDLLNTLREENEALDNQILTLNGQKDSLISERDMAIQQRDSLVSEQIKMSFKLDSMENQLVLRSDSLRDFRAKATLIEEVVKGTRINLFEASAAEKADGKGTINKLKGKNKEKWKYTYCKIRLANSELDLNGLQFAMRIVDRDNYTFLENREDNKVYPGAKGHLKVFNYLDATIALDHINYQGKTGENYDIQFVFFYEDKEYLLENGQFSLFEDGTLKKY